METAALAPFLDRIVEVVAIALAFIGRGQERLGIAGTHLQFDDAGPVIDKQHLLPRLAAVGRLEETAFLVGAVEPAERADVDDVGVLRMDDDTADLEALLEAHVLPRLAAVHRLVNAVA